jgi:predicted metal-dependent hydrolase
LYPKEYVQFLVHFHGDRDYFECHEILEDYWKQTDSGNKDSIWVGLIQTAVSCYHHRRNNYNGAKKTLEKAVQIFIQNEHSLLLIGLDKEGLFGLLEERKEAIQSKKPYLSFQLPITDPSLLHQCQQSAHELGVRWGQDSDMANKNIIHKHLKRDRTPVIEERNEAILKRKKQQS